ncbi:bifunctional [glutamine synthetase] adenylyltransferase/[glutamine synthetase]-adenylyl-L-tyrosine phosphorylase [Ornithinimicrobium avium]|uniref:Bifunctional glutamine synthetase adenylyltransferase/adenylyl-removing enzyme n=1 Tax=Ornithinimicrobium avium TaxID=2283195 RepID=A0A345NJ34_9MICO|nr:bifunctional [glutamine synthetase] adenylyltransferase/[glutamine synthetase]-adenylyl-L-tyrosine phosphorylase [Ornithinimicrobium avium]AXH95042.1 bifunctional [glutamine synthetase] adenylyltransferase/[glutamine synthetase]-adenylyl-L-tyrosine phosphorylase [Ornithinimicrobium avium]
MSQDPRGAHPGRSTGGGGRAGGGTGRLVRAGLTDTGRAAGHLQEVEARAGDLDTVSLLADLGLVADPDGALLMLVRLLDPSATGRDGRPAAAHVLPVLRGGGDPRRRLLALLGGSVALGDHLLRHPEHVGVVAEGRPPEPEQVVEAVRGHSGREGAEALRVAYRRELLRVATADLTSEDPVALMPQVGAALADLAAAALRGALLLARADTEGEETCDLAVVAMGKTGGRELNYVSDVDVIFLAAPRDDHEEEAALGVGAALASAVIRICGQSTAEGALWQVDAALRPEGRRGPLVRSLESHKEYYRRWAKTWEFQALLKARHVAGEEHLTQEWLDVVRPMVWDASGREHFVDDVQAMRRRVEDNVRAEEADRQLKLGPGGLRDIEFSVQLLQLVHGRADDELRSGTTLEALAALRDGGYVGRDDARVLDEAYRLLRCLEHRVQLHRMRRTHLMPTAPAELRQLGRAMGERGDAQTAVVQRWRAVQRDVRRLHERLFYRPLLSAVARLSTEEARLSPEAARARLAALGFRDPAGAMRHIGSLTDGLSRRATIQRHLLPVMLSWFADGADPDAGLLAFRQISDALGTTHWYLGMLRDEGSAAQRLAGVLASSRYAVDLLLRSPGTVSVLGDQTGQGPPDRAALVTRMSAAAERQERAEEAFLAVRGVRARELVRVVLGHLVGGWTDDQVRAALTDLTEAYLEAALRVARARVLARREEEPAAVVVVVGMGRLGGREMGYASDADVMYVYDPLPGATPELAGEQAADVLGELRRGLAGSEGPDPVLELDADLRPEGRSGPLVRSLEAYRAYYARWSAGWESQALLRARPVAGDEALAAAFTELVEPLRWPEDGISDHAVHEIRRLKARVEAERLPRGADPRTHLKLGRGGLSDVEWVVQLLQLQHAHALPALQTTSTLQALAGLVDAGLVRAEDATQLEHAWRLASRIRGAGVVWRGRAVDSVPSSLRDAEGVSRVMGRPPGRGTDLAEEWRRAGRHARAVVERLFYGEAGALPTRATEPAVRGRQRLPGRAAGFRRAATGPPPSPRRFPRPRPGDGPARPS